MSKPPLKRSVVCSECDEVCSRREHLELHFQRKHPGKQCLEKGQQSIFSLFNKEKGTKRKQADDELSFQDTQEAELESLLEDDDESDPMQRPFSAPPLSNEAPHSTLMKQNYSFILEKKIFKFHKINNFDVDKFK